MRPLLQLSGVFTILGISTSLTLAGPITQSVIFGDSLTDVGNVYDLSGGAEPVSPPNWEGRYSDGRTWTEIRAELHGLPVPTASRLGGTNYAHGGAETGTGASSIGNGALNMLDQMDAYLAAHTPNGSEQFVIWGGVNDLISAYFITQTPPNLGQSVANLSELINSLADAGGSNFLVLNMFPLVVTPFGLSRMSSLRTQIQQSEDEFNLLLVEEVDRLRLERGLSIEYGDVHGKLLEMMADPTAYGFTNVIEPASDEDTGEIVPNQDEFMFWDIVHPTTKTHELLAMIAEPSADFDNDGDVDAEDFITWQTSFGLDDGGDTNGDGDSDGTDFLTWQQQFSSDTTQLAASQGVPEPSTVALLVGMAAISMLVRSRKFAI